VSNSPNAVKEAKRLVRDVAGLPVTDALVADTAERIAQIRASEEGREGVRSFLEKRKPGWLG
jgi:methylglutaconyl-CoA hydratase